MDPVVPTQIQLIAIYENRRAEPWAPLLRPAAVAALPDGQIYFADLGAGRVHRFDADGFFVGGIDPAGPQMLPLDLATHGFLLFVLDSGTRQVLRYSADGAYRDVFVDLQRLDPAARIEPSALAVDRDGRLAVTDVANHRVVVTGPFLQIETVVGEFGRFESQFQEPRGVCFGTAGVLYVSDRGNRRVQAFDRTGFLVRASTSVDDLDGIFVAPSGLASDRFGNVFVCDTGRGEVVVLSPDLRPLTFVGTGDMDVGYLARPVDCAIGPDDRLFVVDLGREALLVYEILYP
jgi:sugar lactone lactonase YvrE